MAITLFEWVFARREYKPLDEKLLRHERIHIAQNREMAYLGFYLWYLLEFLIRLILYRGNGRKAYKNVSLEREAYRHDDDPSYIDNRSHYRWFKYIRGVGSEE